MRDPERIDRITKKFAEAWKGVDSDQRFGQFLSNLHGLGPQDVFYTEDDVLETALDSVMVGMDYVGAARTAYIEHWEKEGNWVERFEDRRDDTKSSGVD